MGNFIDLTGERFGRLIVVRRTDNDKCGDPYWLCECDCGEEKIIRGHSLKSNRTRSCGCLLKEKASMSCKERNFKHGHSIRGENSKVYKTWKTMVQRCTNPDNQKYPIYGGRGITVCERWREFANFLKDLGEPPTKDHSIDRIDNNEGYSKSNCRWATPKQQARNRRNNRLITFKGKTQCIAAWAEEYGMNYHLLWKRIYVYNWLIEKSLTTPKQPKRKK